MKHTLIALLVTLAAACGGPRDTLYHVSSDVPEDYYEAVVQCAAEWQALVPFEISVQRGGLVDERVSAYSRVMPVTAQARVVSYWVDPVVDCSEGCDALGETDDETGAIVLATDAAFMARSARNVRQDVEWLRKRVACHEMGHSLGMTHTACPAGALMAPLRRESVNAPGACDAREMARMHGPK